MVPTIGMRWISPFLHVKYNFYIIPKVQFTLQKTLLMSTLFKICKIRNICCDTHALSITSGLCSLTMVVPSWRCFNSFLRIKNREPTKTLFRLCPILFYLLLTFVQFCSSHGSLFLLDCTFDLVNVSTTRWLNTDSKYTYKTNALNVMYKYS